MVNPADHIPQIPSADNLAATPEEFGLHAGTVKGVLGKIAATRYAFLCKIDDLAFRSPEKNTDPRFVRRRSHLVIGALASCALFLVPATREALDKYDGIECSENTVEVSIGYGDTIWKKAGEIKGSQELSRLELVGKIIGINPNVAKGLSAGDTIKLPERCEQ